MSYSSRIENSIRKDVITYPPEWTISEIKPQRAPSSYGLTTLEWEFPHPETQSILKQLSKIDNLSDLEQISISDSSFKKQILRLGKTLSYWETLSENRIGNSLGIIKENLVRGNEFAEELDDAIKYSMRISSAVGFIYGTEAYPDTIEEVESLDQFFSPQHLLPFKYNFDEKLYDRLFIKKNPLSESFKARFKEAVRDTLTYAENPVKLDDYDRLKLFGNSSFIELGYKLKTKQKGLVALDNLLSLDTTDNFNFKAAVVTTKPGTCRPAVVPDLKTYNSLRLLEMQVQEATEVPEDCFFLHDFSWVKEYLDGSFGHYFIQSDQEKCGITFSLELLLYYFSILEEEYPSWDFHLAKGYLKAEIFRPDGSSMGYLKNGVGLGMLAGSVSRIVATLFRMWKQDQDPKWQLDGRFLHDDQVIKLWSPLAHKDPVVLLEIQNLGISWDRCMEEAGLTVHKRKPFMSRHGVFLEVYGEYFPVDVRKRCQKVGNLFHALCKTNIVHAKEFVASCFDSYDKHLLNDAFSVLEIIFDELGCEFSKEEIHMPFEVGGWIRVKEKGINLLFQRIDEGGIPLPFQCLLLAKRYARKKTYPQEKFSRKIISLLPEKTGWEEELGRSSIRYLLERSPSPDSRKLRHISLHYELLYKERQKIFSNWRRYSKELSKINFFDISFEEGGSYFPPSSWLIQNDSSVLDYTSWSEIPDYRSETDLNRNIILLSQWLNLESNDYKIRGQKDNKTIFNILYDICYLIRKKLDSDVSMAQLNFVLNGGNLEVLDLLAFIRESTGKAVALPEGKIHPIIKEIFGWKCSKGCLILDNDRKVCIPVIGMQNDEVRRIDSLSLMFMYFRERYKNDSDSLYLIDIMAGYGTWDNLNPMYHYVPEHESHELDDIPIAGQQVGGESISDYYRDMIAGIARIMGDTVTSYNQESNDSKIDSDVRNILGFGEIAESNSDSEEGQMGLFGDDDEY